LSRTKRNLFAIAGVFCILVGVFGEVYFILNEIYGMAVISVITLSMGVGLLYISLKQ